jgi:hypothetical protein
MGIEDCVVGMVWHPARIRIAATAVVFTICLVGFMAVSPSRSQS